MKQINFKKFLGILILCILLSGYAAGIANACGCGLAIADPVVFNSLKETQAYLMIDVKDEKSYSEMAFFRMVSMDAPHDVTLVFPMAEIPNAVEGKKISAAKFKLDYRVNEAETNFIEQDYRELLKKMEKIQKDMSPNFMLFVAGGLVGEMFKFVMNSLLMATGAAFGGESPVASFAFDGGRLELYDVKSMASLEQLVRQLNIPLSGDVQNLVTKYKDHYVAVLKLNVPSVLDEKSRNFVNYNCAAQAATIRKELETKTSFTESEIYQLTAGTCAAQLNKLVTSVTTKIDSDIEGTLVDMQFTGQSNFFYPTSIVNSYKYPISEQKYFITMPTELDMKLSSSKPSAVASVGSKRWYKVTSTEEDIKGQIIRADFRTRLNDIARTFNQFFYRYATHILFIVIIAVLFLPFAIHKKFFFEPLSGKNIAGIIVSTLIGGYIFSAIVMLLSRKPKLALILFFCGLMAMIWFAFSLDVVAPTLYQVMKNNPPS